MAGIARMVAWAFVLVGVVLCATGLSFLLVKAGFGEDASLRSARGVFLLALGWSGVLGGIVFAIMAEVLDRLRSIEEKLPPATVRKPHTLDQLKEWS